MDNYQKVEQIVNKTGCSYEEAKTALEGCGWDMLDAVISLERDGKISKEASEKTEAKAEEVEVISEVTAEAESVSVPQITYSYDGGGAGSKSTSGSSDKSEGAAKPKRGIWKRFKSIMTNNRMVVLKSNGQKILDLPVWIPIVALIAFFWATLILAVIAMLFGCRFHFEGEDLGKTNINSTMDKATDYAEKVKNDLAGKVNERQNTNN